MKTNLCVLLVLYYFIECHSLNGTICLPTAKFYSFGTHCIIFIQFFNKRMNFIHLSIVSAFISFVIKIQKNFQFPKFIICNSRKSNEWWPTVPNSWQIMMDMYNKYVIIPMSLSVTLVDQSDLALIGYKVVWYSMSVIRSFGKN